MSWNQKHGEYIKYPKKDKKIGHKTMPREDIAKTVERLHVNKFYHPNPTPPPQRREKPLTQEQLENLLSRIADKDINRSKTPDTQRTGADNYFNGWKAQEIIHNMWRGRVC